MLLVELSLLCDDVELVDEADRLDCELKELVDDWLLTLDVELTELELLLLIELELDNDVDEDELDEDTSETELLLDVDDWLLPELGLNELDELAELIKLDELDEDELELSSSSVNVKYFGSRTSYAASGWRARMEISVCVNTRKYTRTSAIDPTIPYSPLRDPMIHVVGLTDAGIDDVLCLSKAPLAHNCV